MVGLLLVGCCLFIPVLFTYCCSFDDFAARCLPKVDDDRVMPVTDDDLRSRGISESLVRKKQEREIAQRLQLNIGDTQTAYKKPGARRKQEEVGKGGGRSVNGRWVPDKVNRTKVSKLQKRDETARIQQETAEMHQKSKRRPQAWA